MVTDSLLYSLTLVVHYNGQKDCVLTLVVPYNGQKDCVSTLVVPYNGQN